MTTALVKQPELDQIDMITSINDDDVENFNHSYTQFASLTKIQTKILMAVARVTLSNDNVTDKEIANRLGISRHTIIYNRANPRWQRALAVVMRDCIKGNIDSTVRNLQNLSKTNARAAEVLLRTAEVYQPVNRNMNQNQNLNISMDASGDPSMIIDQFLLNLMNAGWSAERIGERARELAMNEA